MGLALLHEAVTHGRHLVALAGMALCAPPIFVWITYRECMRAWRGEPSDELRDVSIPALIVVVAVLVAVLVVN